MVGLNLVKEFRAIEVNNKQQRTYLFKHKYTHERCKIICSSQRLAFNLAMNYLKKFGEDNEITLLNNMHYKIFLEDNIERTLDIVYHYTYNKVYLEGTWMVARNYEQFVKILNELKDATSLDVSFDHDLDDEHYNIGGLDNFTTFDYSKTKIPTGLDCAKYLIEFLKNKNIETKIYVHSLNPVGAQNIINLFNDNN